MDLHESFFADAASKLSPEELRREFLVSGLFQPGEVRLRYWEIDRTILGAICPVDGPIALPNPPALKSASFLERREAGIINIGGPGTVQAGAAEFRLGHLDALYLGRGSGPVSFSSETKGEPARFWLLSYPAQTPYPSKHVDFSKMAGESLGAPSTANERRLYKLIHPAAFPTCQVVMGLTLISPGSVWNTMPPHTHLLRSEVYLYFGMKPGDTVFHFMGRPQQTRHLVVHDTDAVLSPPWSIHCGAGTANYGFIWGMGGENQDFTDMQRAETGKLL
jgi:4-deoxy-L-threo-5-hexosulose-uronate ketol-isomerase